MYKSILNTEQAKLLPVIKEFKREYYLVGGTAIALQAGHRQSIDFDLFKTKAINKKKISTIFEKYKLSFKLLYQESNQLHVLVNNVKITFFEFGFEVPHEKKFEDIISMPDLINLAAMKAYALGRRAKWKDYVDLFWLLKNHCSLGDISKRAGEIFGSLYSEKLFRQQLCYFNDIDYSEEVIFAETNIDNQTICNFLQEKALEPF